MTLQELELAAAEALENAPMEEFERSFAALAETDELRYARLEEGVVALHLGRTLAGNDNGVSSWNWAKIEHARAKGHRYAVQATGYASVVYYYSDIQEIVRLRRNNYMWPYKTIVVVPTMLDL